MEYTASRIDRDDWHNRIKYHRPNLQAIGQIALMRTYAENWGIDILKNVPPGREMALALTKIEEALMWANAGIAREADNWAEEQPEK